MTNREWLSTLSDEDFARWCFWKNSFSYTVDAENGDIQVEKISEFSPTLYEASNNSTYAELSLVEWLKQDRESFEKYFREHK